MLNVGVVKGFHKSVLVWVAEMTALLVKVVLPLLPESLSVNRFPGKEFSRLKWLNGNGFESLIDSSYLNLVTCWSMIFPLFNFPEHFIKEIFWGWSRLAITIYLINHFPLSSQIKINSFIQMIALGQYFNQKIKKSSLEGHIWFPPPQS